jgi:hypothetical protein
MERTNAAVSSLGPRFRGDERLGVALPSPPPPCASE